MRHSAKICASDKDSGSADEIFPCRRSSQKREVRFAPESERGLSSAVGEFGISCQNGEVEGK